MTTGAGGAVITNSKNLADKVRFLSTTSKIIRKNTLIHDEVGYNYKMPSLNAAMGIGQLKQFKEIKRNKKFFLENMKVFLAITKILKLLKS